MRKPECTARHTGIVARTNVIGRLPASRDLGIDSSDVVVITVDEGGPAVDDASNSANSSLAINANTANVYLPVCLKASRWIRTGNPRVHGKTLPVQ